MLSPRWTYRLGTAFLGICAVSGLVPGWRDPYPDTGEILARVLNGAIWFGALWLDADRDLRRPPPKPKG